MPLSASQKKPIIHLMEQGTQAWFDLKAGIPSSSNFHLIITADGSQSKSIDDYAFELATEKFIGGKIDDGFSGNKYTERGNRLEPVSCADYQMTKQVEIEHVGFITDYLKRWGASTDGLISDDGVVEFKNLTTKIFMKLFLWLKEHDTLPGIHLHKQQVQGELFVTQRKWCDLVFYNPSFDTIIRRFNSDISYHRKLEKQLKICISERNRILKLAKD